MSQECVTAFNDLKLAKKYKYIVFKLTDDNKEIVVEEASADKDWETFREALVNATSKNRAVRCCRARLLAPVTDGGVFRAR